MAPRAYHDPVILVSCRKHFDSNQLFAPLAFRDYPNLSDTTKFTTLTYGELKAAIADKHVVVFVHGFRNPLKNVADAYKKLELEMKKRGLIAEGNYDLAIGFVWPGFQTPLGFFPAVPWANRSASYFRELMKTLNASAHTVDVQTHSLGARVALQALAFEHEAYADNLMLTAPAVDNESLEPKKEFHDALKSCRRCLVYHSTKDKVLKVLYRVGALDKALGLNGHQHPSVIRKSCPEVFTIDCSAVVIEHGGYRRSGEVYEHWIRVLADDTLPRFETLKKDR